MIGFFTHYFAAEATGASPNGGTTAIIVVAVLSLLGTIATVGYKYRNTEKRKDPNQVIFDQVNNFIAEQRKERDDLRKELIEVKKENRQLNDEIEKLRDELDKERRLRGQLEDKIARLTSRADQHDKDDKTTLLK